MHLEPLILDLAVILGVSSVVSLLFQKIKQPVVLGYLVAGFIVGPYTPPFSLVHDIEGIRVWADLGVVFLMFSLGLHFSFGKLAKIGSPALFSGIFEVLVMFGLGCLLGYLLGFSFEDRLFLGAILSVSSTAIIIKTLEEMGLKEKKLAHLIFGILIVEDLMGILILITLPLMVSVENFSGWILMGSFLKLVGILVLGSIGGYLLVPPLINWVGKKSNDEAIIILALALCLGCVAMALAFGYSAPLGAFLMGLMIAESQEGSRIEILLKPVRDLFAAVFFVSIGMLLNPDDIKHHVFVVVAVCGLTLFGKIFSTASGLILVRQNKVMAFQSGCSLAQIGEFSFIIASLGLSLGVMSEFLYPVAVVVSIVTTFTTPYLIRFSMRWRE